MAMVANVLHRLGNAIHNRNESDDDSADRIQLRPPDPDEDVYDELDDNAPDVHTPEQPTDEEWNYH